MTFQGWELHPRENHCFLSLPQFCNQQMNKQIASICPNHNSKVGFESGYNSDGFL